MNYSDDSISGLIIRSPLTPNSKSLCKFQIFLSLSLSLCVQKKFWTREFSILPDGTKRRAIPRNQSSRGQFDQGRLTHEGNILRSSDRLIAQQCVHGCPGWAIARSPRRNDPFLIRDCCSPGILFSNAVV